MGTPAPPNSTTTTVTATTLNSCLQNSETLYGLFFDTFSPVIAEIAAHAGYDFVIIDMEHGFGGISESLSCLRALAVLRLPECSATWAKKALDLGPQRIMFPMIDTPNLAHQALSYCRYPHAGIRGVAYPIIRASKYGLDSNYLDWCEKELLIICQVESKEAVDNIDEIVAVDGVDCAMIGPRGLSANMGYMRDPYNEEVMKQVSAVEKAVLGRKPNSNGPVYLAGLPMGREPSELKKRGYHMVCGAVDISSLGMLRSKMSSNLRLQLNPKGNIIIGENYYY